jgi:hypothetical protein
MRHVAVLATGLTLSAALLLAGAVTVTAEEPTPTPTATLTPAPTEAPTATPTPAPTEAATATPRPEPTARRDCVDYLPGCPDAHVEIATADKTERARVWTIAVTGGSASVDVVTLPTDEAPTGVGFDVGISGQSAIVVMTVTLPPGWVLTYADCIELDGPRFAQVTGTVVPPRTLVLEVVPGGDYLCGGSSSPAQRPSPKPRPTPPSTDAGDDSPHQSPGPALLTVVGIVAAGLLITVRPRRAGC